MTFKLPQPSTNGVESTPDSESALQKSLISMVKSLVILDFFLVCGAALLFDYGDEYALGAKIFFIRLS